MATPSGHVYAEVQRFDGCRPFSLSSKNMYMQKEQCKLWSAKKQHSGETVITDTVQ